MSRRRAGVALGVLLGTLAILALVVFLVVRPSGLVRADHRGLLEGSLPSGTSLPYGLEVPRGARLLGGAFSYRIESPGPEARYGFEAALIADPDDVGSVIRDIPRFLPLGEGSPESRVTEGRLGVSGGRLAILQVSVSGAPAPPKTVPVPELVTGGPWRSTGSIRLFRRNTEIRIEEGILAITKTAH